MKMNKKKVLYVLLEQWTDFEYAYIAPSIHFVGRDRFQNVIVGLTKEPVTSIGGLKVVPDYDLDEAAGLDYDILILIGGNTWKETKSEALDTFVKSAAAQGKTVAAICNASAYLGTLGLLNDVNHTANDLNEMKEWAGDAYTNEAGFCRKQAVADKNIITANGSASLEFGREIMRVMQLMPEEGISEWYQFYKKGCYQE